MREDLCGLITSEALMQNSGRESYDENDNCLTWMSSEDTEEEVKTELILVPKKNNGRNRGSAQGDILRTRVAEEHNYDRFEHQDSTRVTPGGAFEHLMSQT